MKLANLSQWNNFSPILIPREISGSEGSMFDYFSIDPLPQMNLRSLPDKRVLLYFFFFSTKNQFYLLFLILWKFGLKIGLSNLNVQESYWRELSSCICACQKNKWQKNIYLYDGGLLLSLGCTPSLSMKRNNWCSWPLPERQGFQT